MNNESVWIFGCVKVNIIIKTNREINMNINTVIHKKFKTPGGFAFFVAAGLMVIIGILYFQYVASAVPERIPNPASGATNTVRVYVSPTGSNGNDGLTEGSAVNTIARANEVVQAKWDAGLARGDVEVRLTTGIHRANWVSANTWEFAPAKDKKVYFIPAWYTTEADAKTRPGSDYPYISGQSTSATTALRPLLIRPKKNFGGTFEIAYLRAEYFNNGFSVDGTWMTDSKNAEGDDYPGVMRGLNAPIKSPVIRNSIIRHIGNVYAVSPADTTYTALHLINTSNAVVDSVLFENIEEDTSNGHHLHAIYGYGSSGVTVKNSQFKQVTSDPVRYRDSSNSWRVENNNFVKAGVRANVSEWFCDKDCFDARTEPRFAECKSVPATLLGNTSDGLGYDGRALVDYLPWDNEQALPCTNTNNIGAPSIVDYRQDGEGSYYVKWDNPMLGSQLVTNYEVYINGSLVATVPATTKEYRATGLSDSVDHSVYVRAVGAAQGSPRTANRLWFNLVPYVDVPVTVNPTVRVDFSEEPSPVDSKALSQAVLSVDPNSACGNITYASLVGTGNISSPDNVTLLGGVAFNLQCAAIGDSSRVSLQLGETYSDTSVLRVYKYKAGSLVDISSQTSISTADGKTTISYSLTDGGELDEDGVADGKIIDPVYIGVVASSPVSTGETLAETGQHIHIFALIGLVFSLAGGAYVRKLLQ